MHFYLSDILFYISIYVFCICEITTWNHFLHLLGTLIDTQSIPNLPPFIFHLSEWLLSALGLFPPSVWPTLPSTLRQVFLKRKKSICCLFIIFYLVNAKKTKTKKTFLCSVRKKYKSFPILPKCIQEGRLPFCISIQWPFYLL